MAVDVSQVDVARLMLPERKRELLAKLEQMKFDEFEKLHTILPKPRHTDELLDDKFVWNCIHINWSI